METKVSYTMVGLFVVIMIGIIIFFAFWLSVGIGKQDYKAYLVYMNESVTGLEKDAPVKYNGVDVGTVENIKLNLENPEQVILLLKIKPDTPITQNTEAVLMEQGITGIAYIGLRGGNHAKPLEAEPGQEYPVIKSAPSFFVRLDTTLQDLTTNITSLTLNFKKLMSDENLQSINHTLKNIDTMTTTLADNNKELDESIKSMQVFLKNSAKASDQLPEAIQSIKDSAKALKTMSKNVSQVSTEINGAIKSGTIAIQSFSNQLMPEAYGTLKNMKAITGNIKSLSTELKQNPSIVVRGKKPSKRGPGE